MNVRKKKFVREPLHPMDIGWMREMRQAVNSLLNMQVIASEDAPAVLYSDSNAIIRVPSGSAGGVVKLFRLTSLAYNSDDETPADWFNAVEFDGRVNIGSEVRILKQPQFRPSRSSVKVEGNYYFFDWLDLSGYPALADGNFCTVTLNPLTTNVKKVFAAEPRYVEGDLDVPSGSGGHQVPPFDLNYGGMILAVKLAPWKSTGEDNGIEWFELTPARKLIDVTKKLTGHPDVTPFAAIANDWADHL